MFPLYGSVFCEGGGAGFELFVNSKGSQLWGGELGIAGRGEGGVEWGHGV